MRNIFAVLVIYFAVCNCSSSVKQTMEGDLSFKLVDAKFFEMPDSVLVNLETKAKTGTYSNLTEQDKNTHKFLVFLTQNKLLRTPFVHLRRDNGEIAMVFLDTIDYNKLKDYSVHNLLNSNKKIRIRAEVAALKFDSITVYKATKLLSVDIQQGMTYWKK